MAMLSIINHLMGEGSINNKQLQESHADHISRVPSRRSLLLLEGCAVAGASARLTGT
jgi:hypothetical protein